MLDAGFTTISYLRRQIVPEGMEEELIYDQALQRIGIAVVEQMQRYCDRLLVRRESYVFSDSAQAFFITLPLYPVEAIESVRLCGRYTSEDITYLSTSLNPYTGVMHWGYLLAPDLQSIEVTVTGGYWLDDGQPQPEGSTALPSALLQAWVMQVQAIAESTDLFHTKGVRGKSRGDSSLPSSQLLPAVAEILNPYRRLA